MTNKIDCPCFEKVTNSNIIKVAEPTSLPKGGFCFIKIDNY